MYIYNIIIIYIITSALSYIFICSRARKQQILLDKSWLSWIVDRIKAVSVVGSICLLKGIQQSSKTAHSTHCCCSCCSRTVVVALVTVQLLPEDYFTASVSAVARHLFAPQQQRQQQQLKTPPRALTQNCCWCWCHFCWAWQLPSWGCLTFSCVCLPYTGRTSSAFAYLR